jgi:hypothetical protein
MAGWERAMENRDLPEWIRVISIFVLAFALTCMLGALAGAHITWVDGEAAYGPHEERP